MTLSEKIIQIYPELAGEPFYKFDIEVRNDSDGKGDYIAKWEHPTLAKPTDDQLK
jgi:hypothetical protein